MLLAIGAGAGAEGAHYRDTIAARALAQGATIERSSARSVRVLWRAETSEKVVALTFDDGPGSTLTAPLLDVLREKGVRATFCLVGQRAYDQRDLVRREMRDGHELANHTWSHADLGLEGCERVKSELERTDQLLADLTGRRPVVIRPPYGRINGALLEHAAQSGQKVLLWDIKLQEARFDSAGNVNYVLDHMSPGSVFLGHDAGADNRRIGTQAISELIDRAQARGYTFLTASEMFQKDGTSQTA